MSTDTGFCPVILQLRSKIDPAEVPPYADGMRWDALFQDMEAQLAAEQRLVLESEVSERARVEIAGIALADRLRAALGRELAVLLSSGLQVSGVLAHVGSEWIVLNEAPQQWLVPYSAVARYQGVGRDVLQDSGVRARMGLASALRGLARDRSEVTVHLAMAATQERALFGVIDRVGKDHFDLAVTSAGEARRQGNVSSVVTVPFATLAALRSLRGQEL